MGKIEYLYDVRRLLDTKPDEWSKGDMRTLRRLKIKPGDLWPLNIPRIIDATGLPPRIVEQILTGPVIYDIARTDGVFEKGQSHVRSEEPLPDTISEQRLRFGSGALQGKLPTGSRRPKLLKK